MASNDSAVTVRIVSDASGVKPGVEQAGTSIESLQPILADLSAQIAAMTAKMNEGFASGAAGAKQLAGGLEQAKVAASGASSSIGEMSERLHFGGLSVGIFEKAFAPLVEIVAAAFAVDRVGEFINKMGEAAEKVAHLSQTFGMTTTEVQQLQGVATATGISFDALAKGMQMLDRNMVTAVTGSRQVKQAMDAVGISMDDGRTQMQKLEVVADKFADMADGPKKVALAMQLFGRSGAQLIPILNMGSAGIAQLNEKMDEYGVKNAAAIEKGALLADTVNETKLGFIGIENTLMEALAPAFTDLVTALNEVIQSFIQSYQEGGTVKEVFVVLSGTIEALVTTFEGLGQIIAAIQSAFGDMASAIGAESGSTFGHEVPTSLNYTKQALETLRNLVVFIKDGILIAIEELKLGFIQLSGSVEAQGHVIVDALTFNWGDIEADWNAGLNAIDAATHKTTNDVVAMAKEMHDAFTGAFSLRDIPALPPELQGLQTPKGSGSFDYNPTGTPKKEKKPKDDLVQKRQEELEAKKAAWEMEQIAQGTAQEYSLQSEADYWQRALQRTDLSAKDKLSIEQKWIAAEKALQREEINAKLEGYKEDLDRAGQNWSAKEKILEAEQAYVVRMYGAQSKEAQAAAKAVADAKRQEAKQVEQIQDEIAKHQEQLRLIEVDEAEAAAKFRVEMGQETERQLIQQEKGFEDQRFAIRLEALNREKLLVDPDRDPVKYQQICDQIELLEKQHQQKLTQIDQQAALQRTSIERGAINSISQSWATAISQMVTLQASFATTLKSLWQGIQQAIGGALEQILEKFIATELMKLVYGKATAQAQIGAEAAKAGAGGVASMAAAPWPLDMGAPAFGVAMSTAALSFSGMNMAAGGWWDVTEGPVYAHNKEMILPAWAAEPLRQMISGAGSGPANFNGPAAANDGGDELHLHLHGTLIDRRSVEGFLHQHRREVGGAMRAYARTGGSVDPTRPRG